MASARLRRLFPRKLARNCSCSTLVLLLLFVTFIFLFNMLMVVERHSQNDDLICNTERKRLPFKKDAFHIVTAASSGEFKPLLKLIDSLSRYADTVELSVWSLDLSLCQVKFLEEMETDLKLRIEQFPYHIYPLHIRSFHLTAVKPIVLELASKTYGEALWASPNAIIHTGLKEIIGKIGDQKASAIVGSGGAVIGMNYHRYKSFLTLWADCARDQSCIKKYALNGILHHLHDTDDKMLQHFMAGQRLDYETLDGIKLGGTAYQSPSLLSWENSASKLCKRNQVCILTGNHQSHGCLTPQLGNLRRNKMKYCERHSYTYIEETYGFHKHGPCLRYWNKIQAILKHLPDCEILLWLDTDCVFTNNDITVESILQKYPNKEVLINWPTSDRMINAGVLLLKGSQSVRRFFENTTTGKFWSGDWCKGGKADQAGIRDQVLSKTLEEKVVVKKDDKLLQGLCGWKNGKCMWKENDYIAHFAPPSCPELHDIVKEFFDKHPQYLT